MTEIIHLSGMTWADPRGYDPVVAAADAFERIVPEVRISWDKRSLQGFESTSVEEMARQYDLMVIDHPHVGAAALAGCLLPLEACGAPEDLDRLQGETVGKSYASYNIRGRQWALPIDAACQVQAIRPDCLGGPLTHWDEVVRLADEGRVVWPLRPPHNLMSFFTLTANLGSPCAVVPGPLVARGTARQALAAMQALADRVDPACHGMDPIAAMDALAAGDRFWMAPHSYLYATYSRPGYRAHPVTFHDMPALGTLGPVGSALGGTGIAISAQTRHPELCTRFALWLASVQVQRGLYAAHNGQPGNAIAWGDEAVNAAVGRAYANTRLTHEAAWLRPRHAGYMGFQEEGSEILTAALTGKIGHDAAIDALDRRFNESFAG